MAEKRGNPTEDLKPVKRSSAPAQQKDSGSDVAQSIHGLQITPSPSKYK
jgi:hypothetical protein